MTHRPAIPPPLFRDTVPTPPRTPTRMRPTPSTVATVYFTARAISLMLPVSEPESLSMNQMR
jgi:hypothetical protein